MSRFVLLAVFCFVGVIQCEIEELQADIGVLTVRNVTEYLLRNQDVKLLQTMEKNDEVRSQIRYTIGRRVNGDRLVASNAASQSWASPQDVRLTLAYPRTGTGAIVSYAEVLVEQSSNVGQGYVVDGGVGQRRITIVIEALRTTYFRHNSQIYGAN